MTDLLKPFKPEVDFTIIISCYFEEKSIDEFYTRLSNTLKKTKRSYEIIFINDGSTDKTFEKLKIIYDNDPNVTAIIDFFKNAGQANAKTPGVMLAKGKAIILIDSDLQLDPEDLPLLIEKYDEGFDIVTGYRKNRQDSLSRTLPSIIANIIMRKASGTRIKDFGCTFKIYDGRLVRTFEFNPFNPWRSVPVIAAADRIAEVPVTHHPRKYGKSGWAFKTLFAYNMENLVNLSERPFQFISAACFILSILFILRIGMELIFPFSILPRVGNGLLLNAMVICFLAIVSVLSIIGEFTIRNFIRIQNRPAYMIRDIQVKKENS